MQLTHPAQRASILFIAAIFAAGVAAQTIVYPAKGQSPDQQKKDEGECHTWAVGQSKYDPANPPPPPAAADHHHRHRHHAGRRRASARRVAPSSARLWPTMPARARQWEPRPRAAQSRRPRTTQPAQQQQQAAPQQSAAGRHGRPTRRRVRPASKCRGYTVK